MAFYSEDKIEEVLEAVDLLELVGRYVTLKRAGNAYKGLCPFHAEKTPSFVVTPQKRMFHCFGCGVGGSAIRFLMMAANLSFPEALEELARRSGVELPARDVSRPRARAEAENKPAIFEVLKEANAFFQAELWSPRGRSALNYLKNRGLTPATARHFGLGLAPSGWDVLLGHLRDKGFSEKIILEAGLAKTGRKGCYDAFRERLMVPIPDAEARVAAFGGRHLGPERAGVPKYLNSPETPVYHKGRLLYGYQRARPFLRAAGLIFLVEGYFDLISLVQAGLNEVAATLGTALTPAHLRLLRGQVTEVMLLFDADQAGQRAAGRALPLLLNAELDGRVLTLPEGHDPDTFVRAFGLSALHEAAAQAQDILDFYAAQLLKSQPPTLAGQARMAAQAKELLGQVPDSAKSRLLRRRLARLLGLEEEDLGGFSAAVPPRTLEKKRESTEAGLDPLAAEIIVFLVSYPECAAFLLTSLAARWPRQDQTARVFDRLREQFEAAGRINPAALALDDAPLLSDLISGALFQERLYSPAESEEVAEALARRLQDHWRKNRQTELSRAIQEAQQKGDEAALLSLLAEKTRLR